MHWTPGLKTGQRYRSTFAAGLSAHAHAYDKPQLGRKGRTQQADHELIDVFDEGRHRDLFQIALARLLRHRDCRARLRRPPDDRLTGVLNTVILYVDTFIVYFIM